ncbi:hypothetical protein ABM024_11475 [Morganella morganii]|uniref:hypothetical protein n=1 Tax=Morganella morganii TaxID=582 RepID=UPI001645FF55|nr:hypothetical protein [Morganella morganii]MBC4002297.1 hypothetical protein [Morganella morganii]HCC5748782.1 hypothetical protein [Morganella morganii]
MNAYLAQDAQEDRQRISEQRREREQEEKKELDHRYYVLGEQGLPVSWDEFSGNFN